ncbi:hypothetical protein BDV33DRAFT_73519 [Aspergillus novoparasiticus]|uniref:Uncharacterized protein n=1 Tax=Aspergillus novoparasiticus TaxID=986946 RepID=A0A5N6E6J6_9EURO|nr:hypothetical protein BDV33DRAFT_73519 [Aspergillus novoparasiticus]
MERGATALSGQEEKVPSHRFPPDDTKTRTIYFKGDKCTQLQRYGQKYSLLERKELILSPLRCSSAKSVYQFSRCAYKLIWSSIERATMKPIEMDALVAFAEATFNKEYQK